MTARRKPRSTTYWRERLKYLSGRIAKAKNDGDVRLLTILGREKACAMRRLRAMARRALRKAA